MTMNLRNLKKISNYSTLNEVQTTADSMFIIAPTSKTNSLRVTGFRFFALQIVAGFACGAPLL